jgi:hypothetical protein
MRRLGADVAATLPWIGMVVAAPACARGLSIADDAGSESASPTVEGGPSDDAAIIGNDATIDDRSSGSGGGSASSSSGATTSSSSGATTSSSSGATTSSSASGSSGGGSSSSGATGTGGRDGGLEGSVCGSDLANIGTADFRIALTFTTTQNGIASLANQRAVCSKVGMLWDLRLETAGVAIETSDAVNVTNLTGSGLVNDGKPHDVLVQRVAKVVTISVDGKPLGSSACDTAFGALPAIKRGTDVCDGHSGQVPFVGAISNVCVESP